MENDKLLHSVLIVENNESLFIVENSESKPTVDNILENQITSEISRTNDCNDEEKGLMDEFDLEFIGRQSNELNSFTMESLLTEELFQEDNKESEEIEIPVKEPQKNYCKFCDRIYESAKILKTHNCEFLSNCSNSKNFRCRLCKKELSKKSFQYHMNTHNSNNFKVECEICSKKFSNDKLLTLHRTVHSGNKPNKCEHCSASFLTRQQLLRHMGTHGIPPPTYECDLCSKEFSYKHYLTLHLRMHSNNPQFVCDYENCQRSFERKDYLNEHYQTAHSNEKKFICKTCDKRFALKKYLRRHEAIHQQTNNPEFTCKICGRILSHKKQLENHLMLHTGERNHICEKCGKSFITKSALTNHMHNNHLNQDGSMQTNYKCSFCDSWFGRLTELNRHISSHHQKPHKCDYCPKSYLHKNQLERHICMHTGQKPKMFECSICNKQLTQRYYLKKHMMKHGGEMKYFCEFCSKGFPSVQQINRHKKSCAIRHQKKMENENEFLAQLQFQDQPIQILSNEQIIVENHPTKTRT